MPGWKEGSGFRVRRPKEGKDSTRQLRKGKKNKAELHWFTPGQWFSTRLYTKAFLGNMPGPTPRFSYLLGLVGPKLRFLAATYLMLERSIRRNTDQ